MTRLEFTHTKQHSTNLLAIRRDVDYKAKFISKRIANKQIKMAKEFLDRVEQEMSK
jgi:uncharacterized protein (UPF0332 family)